MTENLMALLLVTFVFVRVTHFIELCMKLLASCTAKQKLYDDPVRGPWGLVEALKTDNAELKRQLAEARDGARTLQRENAGMSAVLVIASTAAMTFGATLMHFIDAMNIEPAPIEVPPAPLPARVHTMCFLPGDVRRPPHDEWFVTVPFEPWPGPIGIRFPASQLAPPRENKLFTSKEY